MTDACGYVNCTVEFQKFIRKVCVLFMNKQYLKYKFYSKLNWKWIGLNVKEQQIYCKLLFFLAVRDYFWHAKMDVLYVHKALTGVRNNSKIFYGLQ